MIFELMINGAKRRVDVDPARSLLSVLRDDLDLTAAKYGCGEGQCGACTVLIDGLPRRSCTTAVRTVTGRSITTLEGLEQDGKLHPVQQAFVDQDAYQCGYCTAGMIMAGVALLRANAKPSDAEIVKAMDGNVCRCGTYTRIIAALRQASGRSGGAR